MPARRPRGEGRRSPWASGPPCACQAASSRFTISTPSSASRRLSASLAARYALHRAVIVQMVAGEVGEHSGAERQAVQSPLIEAMRRRFHRHVGRAPRHQLGERGLEIDRPGCRERPGRRVDRSPAAVEGSERTDAARAPGGVEEMTEDADRGRLAVGAGHAQQCETAAGVAVPRAGRARARRGARRGRRSRVPPTVARSRRPPPPLRGGRRPR